MDWPDPRLLLLAQAGASCAMAGLIWFVQVVHYPAYRFVGAAEMHRYQAHHQRATSWIVGPPMLVELAAALLLVVRPLPEIHPGWGWSGLGLLGVIWASTAFWQVPLHLRILNNGSAEDVGRLVRSNWLRTAGWSLRATLSLAMLATFS